MTRVCDDGSSEDADANELRLRWRVVSLSARTKLDIVAMMFLVTLDSVVLLPFYYHSRRYHQLKVLILLRLKPWNLCSQTTWSAAPASPPGFTSGAFSEPSRSGAPGRLVSKACRQCRCHHHYHYDDGYYGCYYDNYELNLLWLLLLRLLLLLLLLLYYHYFCCYYQYCCCCCHYYYYYYYYYFCDYYYYYYCYYD